MTKPEDTMAEVQSTPAETPEASIPTPAPETKPAPKAVAPALPGKNPLLILVALVVLALVGLRTVSNSDYWMHIASGTVQAEAGLKAADVLSHTSAEGAVYANPNWLYDKVLAIVHGMGGPGLATLLHIVAVVAAFVLLLPVARRWAGDTAILWTVLLCAWILAPRFEPRPALIGLLFAAVLIRHLSTATDLKKALMVVVPVQVLWANTASSWILAPIIVLTYLVGAYMERNEEEHASPLPLAQWGMLLAATLIAPVLNPFFSGVYGLDDATWNTLSLTQPWISPVFDQMAPTSLVWAIKLSFAVGACGLVFSKQKLPVSLTGLAVVPVFITVNSPYFVDFLAVMAFPFLALSLQALGSFLSTQFGLNNPKAQLGAPLALAACSAFVLVSNNFYVASGSFSSFGLGANTEVVSAAALEDIGSEALPEELINLIPDGGYLAANGHPNFSDHRVAFQGRERLYALSEALRGAPDAWDNFAASNNTEVIVLNTPALLNNRPYGGSTIIPRLMIQQKYRLAYFDGATAVLARPSAATEALLTNTELRTKGLDRIEAARKALSEGSGGSFPKGLSARVFGAAHVFYNLGQHAEALKLFNVATAAAPTWNDGWLHKGMCQLALGKTEDAIDSLNTALRVNKKDVRSWIVLAQAHDKNDNPSEAEQARERAMQIDAQRAAAMLGKAAEEDSPEAP